MSHYDDLQEIPNWELGAAVTPEELEERATAQKNGGVCNWHYDSPFENVSVRVDDVNQFLERRFLDEANTDLDRDISDIRRSECEAVDDDRLEILVTPLSCVMTFLSDFLLEKLRYVATRVMHERKKRSTTKKELLGLVVLHIICASCHECPTVVCDPSEGDHFF